MPLVRYCWVRFVLPCPVHFGIAQRGVLAAIHLLPHFEGFQMNNVPAIADPDGFAEFWQGYLFGLVFTATDEDGELLRDWDGVDGFIRDMVDPKDVEAVLRKHGKYDELRSDCVSFLANALPFIPTSGLDRAGSDFHLTRNDYGFGFCDEDWQGVAALIKLSKPFGVAELRITGTDDDTLFAKTGSVITDCQS